MSLTKEDVIAAVKPLIEASKEDVIAAVKPLIEAAKTEVQQEIRHIGVQVEVYRDEARIALGMLSDTLKVETIGKSNATRLEAVEANAKNITSLVTLHDQQLRPTH